MYVEVESAGEKECEGKTYARMKKKWLANVFGGAGTMRRCSPLKSSSSTPITLPFPPVPSSLLRIQASNSRQSRAPQRAPNNLRSIPPGGI